MLMEPTKPSQDNWPDAWLTGSSLTGTKQGPLANFANLEKNCRNYRQYMEKSGKDYFLGLGFLPLG